MYISFCFLVATNQLDLKANFASRYISEVGYGVSVVQQMNYGVIVCVAR